MSPVMLCLTVWWNGEALYMFILLNAIVAQVARGFEVIYHAC